MAASCSTFHVNFKLEYHLIKAFLLDIDSKVCKETNFFASKLAHSKSYLWQVRYYLFITFPQTPEMAFWQMPSIFSPAH